MNARVGKRYDAIASAGFLNNMMKRLSENRGYALGVTVCLVLAAVELMLYPSFTPAGLVVFPSMSSCWSA